MRTSPESRLHLLFSFIALFMVLSLPLIGKTNEVALWQWDLTFVLLIACYTLGLSMALRPNWSMGARKYDKGSEMDRRTGRRLSGHHPDCMNFADHVVRIRGRCFCAGCLGLGLGCFLSIPLSAVVLLIASPLDGGLATILLSVGALLVAMNLIEPLYGPLSGPCHALLNALLPVAFLLIVSGALAATGEFLNGLWGMVLGFLWIETKKVMSQDRHGAICRDCPKDCKTFD